MPNVTPVQARKLTNTQGKVIYFKPRPPMMTYCLCSAMYELSLLLNYSKYIGDMDPVYFNTIKR